MNTTEASQYSKIKYSKAWRWLMCYWFQKLNKILSSYDIVKQREKERTQAIR